MLSFAILTCTYNAEKELPRTLESVKTQTYAHINHYIIDGLSADNTVRLATEYAEQCKANGSHHNIIIKSEKDGGLYDAMNKALNMAQGDYLVFLNAGDALADDTTIERMARRLEGRKTEELPGVLYGDTDIIDEHGDFLCKRRLQPPEHLTWRSFQMGMLVCHQAFYARTDIAKETPYDLTYRLSADVDWCIRIMKATQEKGLELHNTHLTLCKYLEGGMSVKNHRASLMERFRIMAKHYGLLRTLCVHFWFLIRK